jgi:hypothetical protein
MHTKFQLENLKGRDHLVDLVIEDIKIDIEETGYDNADLIQLAQNTVQRRAFVNMVINLQVL